MSMRGENKWKVRDESGGWENENHLNRVPIIYSNKVYEHVAIHLQIFIPGRLWVGRHLTAQCISDEMWLVRSMGLINVLSRSWL